jgi:hypothetical protein
MEVFVRHLKVLWTAERMLGEIKIRTLTQKIIFAAIAALAGLFGLGMLNLAAFFALQPQLGLAGSALLVGFANLAFAGVLVFFASKLAPGPEVKIVEDVREMALADLEAEAEAVQNEIRLVRDEIMSVHASVSRLLKNPLEMLAPKSIIPLVAGAVQLIKSWDGAGSSRKTARANAAPKRAPAVKPAAKKRAPHKRKAAAAPRAATRTSSKRKAKSA